MGEGEYVHLPNWIPSLKDMLPLCNSFTYNLIVNIDGLPLFSSSPNHKLYPILVSLYKVKMRPLCAGIYSSGKSFNQEMPPTHIYLKKFLKDVEYVMNNPLICQSNEYRMKCFPIFVCDAPARSSLKAIKSHTGYDSCERCMVHWKDHKNRVCLLSCSKKRKTEADFSRRTHKKHHKGISALEKFGVPMVSHFVLDSMHMTCLGVTKRQLLFWKGMPR